VAKSILRSHQQRKGSKSRWSTVERVPKTASKVALSGPPSRYVDFLVKGVENNS
jgi:hypothetical protein